MGWLKPTATSVGRDDAPAAAIVTRCPRCMAIGGIRVATIHAYSIGDAGKIAETPYGYRVACQRCPHIYSVDPSGVFQHHLQSSPLTPEVRIPIVDADPPAEPGVPIHDGRPVPRARPRG